MNTNHLIIDKQILKLSDDIYVKNSVYANVVNYLSLKTNHLISVINRNLCMGPYRIKINKSINFKECQDILPEYIQLNQILNHENECQLWESKKISKINNEDISKDLYLKLYNRIISEKKKLFPESHMNHILFTIMNDAFKEYKKSLKDTSFMKIIGLGPGLTPLGDDVIVGMLLCKNALAYDEESNLKIMSYSKKNTSIISHNFIDNACKNEFSEDLYDFYEMFFIRQVYDEKIVKKVLDFGSSSGFGIIYGFWKYLSIYMKMEVNDG